ncbi:MAG: 3-hydroxybutyryl-CoA dehydrogenase, partial [Proteobacteria bacterium]|nr:3-hydroxybutyryl-CoA dehydrogenase [Pseudomonadota bacterium]
MGVEKFGVIGSGQMGNGIAQVAAASGLKVLMSDIRQDFCDKGMATIVKNLDRMVSKGKLDDVQKQAILNRIETTCDLSDMAGVDFVVEA